MRAPLCPRGQGRYGPLDVVGACGRDRDREERRQLSSSESTQLGQARRERITRTLTFWLRPHFVLRVVSRFQKVAGFDRSMALASSALTALVPLAVVAGTLTTHVGGEDLAERIIDRYELTGGGADAVRDILAPSTAPPDGVGLIGFVFVVLALLSFARAAQRVFEQTWELKPLSVRNTPNELLWLCGLTLYGAASGFLHAELGHRPLALVATLVTIPLCVVLLMWTGRILTARRLAREALWPFAIVGSALVALYLVGAQLYLPHLFSSYATRYGVVGAVFAMISALFCISVIVVGAAALGREVHVELERIRRGERVPDHEVRRQWAEVTTQVRAHWVTLRRRSDQEA
jgi:uncharacterized BrkB/YihY/UPF0761 family membrane protein